MAGLHLVQIIEDIREQGISADHGKTRRSLVHSRFFHHIPYAVDARGDLFAVDDTVFADFFLWDFHHTDDRHVPGLRYFDQLVDARDTAKHEIIPQHDSKRFIGDEVPGAQDSMAKAALLLLPHRHEVEHFGYLTNLGQLVLLAAPLQNGFELQVVVKIVFDDALVPVGDEDGTGHSGTQGFFHDVLDDRPVVDGQHLLGYILASRQRAGPPAGHRDDDFAERLHKVLPCTNQLFRTCWRPEVCQLHASVMISVTVERRAFQRRISWARVPSATSTGGSPARRGPTV